MLKDAVGRLLLVRADGGSQIGFGHVMRSMAIAEEWLSRGGQCVWVTNQPRALDAGGSGRDDFERIAIDAETGTIDDARATRRIAESTRADWVSADLYQFKPDYFDSAGSRGARWMIAHDEPLRINDRINAVLNPGPHASAAMYPGRASSCGLLLGLEYALIRAEIRDRAAAESSPRPQLRVLVTFGGSDPGDFTWQTLNALSGVSASSARIRFILGPGYRGQCAERGGSGGGLDIEYVRYTSNMGAHYAWADLIVCGASTTLWEALYFGVPAVVMPIAQNQRGVFEALQNNPAVVRFERPDEVFAVWMDAAFSGVGSTRGWLAGAAKKAAALVDGHGATRVVSHFLSHK